MTLKSKEEAKAYHKLYYQKNKEKIINNAKEYYENNKEKVKNNVKEYYERNKDKQKEYCKKYREEYKKTEQYIKSCRISNWKFRGVICDDWDDLYDKYINTTKCEECDVELILGNFGTNLKCLDYNHDTGEFRNILCHRCNIRRNR